MSVGRFGIGGKLSVYLINPFIALLTSLTSLQKRSSRIILFLWCILFGLMFMPFEETGDAYQYYLAFSQFKTSDFWGIVKDYFSFDSPTKDLYVSFSYFIVKSFTNNYHILFAFWGTVFGYFYVRSIKFITSYFKGEDKWLFLILILLFLFSNPVYNINGVRFWTASWMAVYGCFKVIVERKYLYILLILSTLLVHGGFSVFIVLFLLCILLGRFEKPLSILYILSFFVSVTPVSELIASYSGFLPVFIDNFTENYADLDTITEKALKFSQEPLYARVLRTTPEIYINLLCISFIFFKNKHKLSEKNDLIFSFALIILSFCNIFGSTTMSVAARYLQVAIPLIIYKWAQNFDVLKQYKVFFYLAPVAYCYMVYYWIKDEIAISDISLYILPAPISLIKNLLFF